MRLKTDHLMGNGETTLLNYRVHLYEIFITFDACACVRMLSCLFVFAHVYLCLIFSYLS